MDYFEKMRNLTLGCCALLLANTAFAQSDSTARMDHRKRNMNQDTCVPYPQNMPEPVFAGSPFLSCGTGLYLETAWLFWTAGQNNLHYGIKGNDTIIVNRDLKSFKDHWSSGVRIVGGYESNVYRLNTKFIWTHLHNNQTTSITPSATDSLFGDWVSIYNAGELSTESITRGTLNFHFDEWDFLTGKEFFVNKYYCVNPYFGFRAVRLHNTFKNLTLGTPTTLFQSFSSKNKTDLYGLSFGFDQAIHFPYGFFVDSMAQFALMFGKYRYSQATFNPTVANNGAGNFNGLNLSQKGHALIPMIDLGVDVGGKWPFRCDSLALGLKVGYEFHVLINAAMEYAWPTSHFGATYGANSIDIPTQQIQNLYFQGLTVTGEFDF